MKKYLHIAVDTEDDAAGNPTIINFFDGERHITFHGKPEKIRRAAWNYLVSFRNSKTRIIIWACNAEYDLVNLFGDWLGLLCTIHYVKSGMLRAIYKDAPITFLDTLRHWSISVKKMGEIIGLEKIDVQGNFENIEYCQRDTEIVWKFVMMMLERYDNLGLSLKNTLPSMAIQLFNKFYKVPKKVFSDEILQFFKTAYYGGRVEVFRFGKITGSINHYDFNSLFPSVMKFEKYPDIAVDKGFPTLNPDIENEGIIHCDLFFPECKISPVPHRIDELFFPYGKNIKGAWTYCELRNIINHGGKILKVHAAMEFKKTFNPFKEYIDFCYDNRLKAVNECDNLFYKLLGNSLYGKFGQGTDMDMIYNNKDIKMESKTAGHVNVIWSAYITAYARIKLFNSLINCSESYYCDTDSIFTPDILPCSKELGDLKKEGEYSEVEFAGNKVYCYDNKYRAKGVPRANAEEFFKTGKTIYKKPLRFRAARVRKLKANVWMDFEKKRKFIYTKRKIFKDGATSAWDLKEYIQFRLRK